ncbi:Universal stress protein family protein [Paraoerskovia marina]|uniref:Universal stress protein family protein n=1 Tax=Paraoerskovia marina TaxID=545619 RepID=A0A1H1M869_9CELL|nr:universal stress protein [Paraoerskovia marina]SDR82936.1 Universal stress protein family protein [Paraoerskovia marina]
MTTTPAPGSPGDGPVVVGVHPGLSEDVARRAGQLAARLGVDLVAVWVDPAQALVHEGGRTEVVPIDPDGAADTASAVASLRQELSDELTPLAVPWTLETTAGDVADRLAAVAERLDATLIVVGTHRAGLGRWAETVVGHALGGRLSHSQHRPVVVLPNLHHDKRAESP